MELLLGGSTPFTMARVLTVNLVHQYGDTFDDYSVTWLNSSGTPINLTGYTATMRIKAKTGGGTGETTLLTLTSAANDGLTIDAPNGKITFSGTPTKMTSGTLAQGVKYVYDLQVASGSEKKTLIRGDFFVDGETTTD